mmetsp:Transcript_27619/g.60759  ORF Transcript_27619/g.60759 Transcript_27619/m.60759 type:complete len:614 (+) Transcript_27619:44-1885(+)
MMPQAESLGSDAGRARRPLLPDHQSSKCTDMPFCLVFLVALFGYVVLAGYGFSHGNTELLESLAGGKDYKGRRCGESDGVESFKKTYFTLADGIAAPSSWSSVSRALLFPVCTTECPEASSSGVEKSYPREAGVCPEDAYADKLCTWYGAQTLHLSGYCIDQDVFKAQVPAQRWLQDLHAAGSFILLSFVIAVLCGYAFLVIMRYCSQAVMLAMVLVVAAVPLLVGCLMFIHPETLAAIIGVHDQKRIAPWLWVASGAVLLLACLFARTLRNVVAVLKATASFLQDCPAQFVQPCLFALLQLVVLGIWLLVLLAVSTVNAKPGDEKECLKAGDLYCVEWNTKSQGYAILFLIFMLYWMLSFLHALSHYGTARAVKEWYFTVADPATGRKVPAGSRDCCGFALTLHGLADGLLHHTGSLAMGSFVVALAKVAYLLLAWAKNVDPQAATNPCVACLYRISMCAAKCVERFIEFVSEQAYVEMALQGTGFIRSAQKALAIAVTRPVLFAMSGSVSRIIYFLGVFIVTIGTFLLTLLLLETFRPAELLSIDAPLVMSVLVGFLVAEVMMHPFSTVARAALHCVVLDEELARREGRSGTVHAPPQMQFFLETCPEENQ